MSNLFSTKLFAAGFSLVISGMFLAMAIIPASPAGLVA